jgi:hypothetical protein
LGSAPRLRAGQRQQLRAIGGGENSAHVT